MAATVTKAKIKEGEKQSPLFEACKNGYLAGVQKYLTAENVNSRDVVGRKSTPLHFAAGGSWSETGHRHREGLGSVV